MVEIDLLFLQVEINEMALNKLLKRLCYEIDDFWKSKRGQHFPKSISKNVILGQAMPSGGKAH